MTNTPNLADAIRSLYPTAEFGYKNNDFSTINWSVAPDPLPTEAEIQAEVTRLQAEYDAQEYARNRASAYPSVGDQLDMMMKDKRDGTTTHQTACEAVKTQFPKG